MTTALILTTAGVIAVGVAGLINQVKKGFASATASVDPAAVPMAAPAAEVTGLALARLRKENAQADLLELERDAVKNAAKWPFRLTPFRRDIALYAASGFCMAVQGAPDDVVGHHFKVYSGIAGAVIIAIKGKLSQGSGSNQP